MSAVALVFVGVANVVVLGGLIAVLRRFLRTLEGVEQAVWHVADELRGGVGLRIGRSRTARPERRPAPAPAVAVPPAEDVDLG